MRSIGEVDAHQSPLRPNSSREGRVSDSEISNCAAWARGVHLNGHMPLYPSGPETPRFKLTDNSTENLRCTHMVQTDQLLSFFGDAKSRAQCKRTRSAVPANRDAPHFCPSLRWPGRLACKPLAPSRTTNIRPKIICCLRKAMYFGRIGNV